MKKFSRKKWYRYLFEFFSIFIAVVSAFALNNWNQNRRNDDAEEKILKEISRGLKIDLIDVSENRLAHKQGINACMFFRDFLTKNIVSQDSIGAKYDVLVSTLSVIINKTGYEALKAKGLEIIKNNDIRFQIIELYDYHYQILSKLEESNDGGLTFRNYFHPINDAFVDYMIFDSTGNIIAINYPEELSVKEKNRILSFLRRIEGNRRGRIFFYDQAEQKIKKLLQAIYEEMDWDKTEIKYPEPVKFG